MPWLLPLLVLAAASSDQLPSYTLSTSSLSVQFDSRGEATAVQDVSTCTQHHSVLQFRSGRNCIQAVRPGGPPARRWVRAVSDRLLVITGGGEP